MPKRMLNAGEAKADELGFAYNIAVMDAGGHLLSFTRQDGAMTGCIDLAINKSLQRMRLRQADPRARRDRPTRCGALWHPAFECGKGRDLHRCRRCECGHSSARHRRHRSSAFRTRAEHGGDACNRGGSETEGIMRMSCGSSRRGDLSCSCNVGADTREVMPMRVNVSIRAEA
jgi:hypothetical protein